MILLHTSIAICFVTTSNALQHCFNVVFLFHSFLVITVLFISNKLRLILKNSIWYDMINWTQPFLRLLYGIADIIFQVTLHVEKYHTWFTTTPNKPYKPNKSTKTPYIPLLEWQFYMEIAMFLSFRSWIRIIFY